MLYRYTGYFHRILILFFGFNYAPTTLDRHVLERRDQKPFSIKRSTMAKPGRRINDDNINSYFLILFSKVWFSKRHGSSRLSSGEQYSNNIPARPKLSNFASWCLGTCLVFSGHDLFGMLEGGDTHHRQWI